MKLINTASPTFPCQAGSNTIILPDSVTTAIGDLIPYDWDMKDVITVPESTHEVDFI